TVQSWSYWRVADDYRLCAEEFSEFGYADLQQRSEQYRAFVRLQLERSVVQAVGGPARRLRRQLYGGTHLPAVLQHYRRRTWILVVDLSRAGSFGTVAISGHWVGVDRISAADGRHQAAGAGPVHESGNGVARIRRRPCGSLRTELESLGPARAGKEPDNGGALRRQQRDQASVRERTQHC